ncbi:ATP-grasp domain-containing protein [Thermodesulforhabdus norvegica]|uniref:Ribosomal protein S6--L-glutamate ligase n=1 Tax=Thermodesulforhabdus norvegica TaxID=39841 RepID=A0A1I4VDK2_9BACT|nr:ATP-grasp domain-containing protein [Thermodesulforhabdus norvegica]SFM99248.1 ribosomal protein S6--L-glutamate ligase [Thermodesulforhabdus norvegica]
MPGLLENSRVKYALGRHLRVCRSIRQPKEALDLDVNSETIHRVLGEASDVFYPGQVLDPLFKALGKRVFPGNFYSFMGNKIRQSLLFQWLGIPHPRTKIYYGARKEERILRDFSFPFVGKRAVGGSQGKEVFLIRDEKELETYLSLYHPAYVQEYIPASRDLRIVVFAGHVIHAYWRIGKPGDFRHNVSRGGSVEFENIPEDALEFARWVAERCGFDEVGLDILPRGESYLVLEANMVYGLEGFRRRGLDINKIFSRAEKEGWI